MRNTKKKYVQSDVDREYRRCKREYNRQTTVEKDKFLKFLWVAFAVISSIIALAFAAAAIYFVAEYGREAWLVALVFVLFFFLTSGTAVFYWLGAFKK